MIFILLSLAKYIYQEEGMITEALSMRPNIQKVQPTKSTRAVTIPSKCKEGIFPVTRELEEVKKEGKHLRGQ